MRDHEKYLSFMEHFRELRRRLLLAMSIFTAFFLLLWFFRNDLLNLYLMILAKSLTQHWGEIVILKMGDKLHAHLVTTGFFAILLSLPFTLVIIGGFIFPALPRKLRANVAMILTAANLLFYAGIVLSYKYILPFVFDFFITYNVANKGLLSKTVIRNSLYYSIRDIVSMTQSFVLVFGLVAQLPLIMMLLSRVGLIRIASMTKYRRHLYVLCFAIGAILTPPDPVSMIMLSIPLILLFELGIVLCRIAQWGNK